MEVKKEKTIKRKMEIMITDKVSSIIEVEDEAEEEVGEDLIPMIIHARIRFIISKVTERLQFPSLNQ